MKRLWLACVLFATAAAADPTFPVYPRTVQTRIGNDLAIDGQLYRIAYFVTPDSPEDVAKYFHHEFHREGVPCTVDGDFREGGVVSAFYTREGIQRSVVVRKHGKRTVGFSVIHDLWVAAKKVPPPPSAVKLEGTLFRADMASRSDVGRSTSESVLVERSLQAVRSDVQRKLESAGYTAVRESAARVNGTQHLILEHTRGAERVVTTLAEIDPTLTAVLQQASGAGKGTP